VVEPVQVKCIARCRHAAEHESAWRQYQFLTTGLCEIHSKQAKTWCIFMARHIKHIAMQGSADDLVFRPGDLAPWRIRPLDRRQRRRIERAIDRIAMAHDHYCI